MSYSTAGVNRGGGLAMIRLWLAAVAVLSLGLLELVDGAAVRLWPLLGEARLASLAVCLALALAAGAAPALRPRPFTRRAALVAAAWLAGTVLSLRLTGGFRKFHGVDLVAFLGTGLLAEELLFRGALYQLALAALPGRRLGPLAAADWISAAAFSLAHLQYHGYRLTPAAAAQLAVTFPMGLVLGWLRGETRSLAAPTAVHLANNLLSQWI